ncbi:MAG: radical SAM family heme chaperone HemW [Eubacterium sp.]
MGSLGIYVHVPFCVKKCNYCDFLSFPLKKEGRYPDLQNYVEVLQKEIENPFKVPESPAYVDTIYIGGGTPSLLLEQQMAIILESLYSNFSVNPKVEITMECNPGTVTAKSLRQYRKLGINRLSIGIQSAVDKELAMLGRIHTFSQAKQAVSWAREAGFDNVSVDLMSAIPGQTIASYEYSLKEILALEPQHISSYSLIIEEGTPFYEKYSEAPPVDEETDRKMYEMTQQLLLARGYARYEISNYARPGFESRHNMKYWTGEDYLGVGLGASSKIGKLRLKNETDFKNYKRKLQNGESITSIEEVLTEQDEKVEFFILGLRCTKGISLAEYKKRFCEDAVLRYGEIIGKICDMGLAERKEDRLFLTAKGIDVSNHVFEMFFE